MDSAQDSDVEFVLFRRDFSQREKLSKVKPPLKMFDLLRNDISAVEDQVSNVQSTLQKLTAMVGSKTPEWLTIQTKFSNILGKIKLHYTIFDDYMKNAETTNQLEIEDYARSIIQPGSTQQTAMLTTLDELNSMAIPDFQKDDGKVHIPILRRPQNLKKSPNLI